MIEYLGPILLIGGMVNLSFAHYLSVKSDGDTHEEIYGIQKNLWKAQDKIALSPVSYKERLEVEIILIEGAVKTLNGMDIPKRKKMSTDFRRESVEQLERQLGQLEIWVSEKAEPA